MNEQEVCTYYTISSGQDDKYIAFLKRQIEMVEKALAHPPYHYPLESFATAFVNEFGFDPTDPAEEKETARKFLQNGFYLLKVTVSGNNIVEIKKPVSQKDEGNEDDSDIIKRAEESFLALHRNNQNISILEMKEVLSLVLMQALKELAEKLNLDKFEDVDMQTYANFMISLASQLNSTLSIDHPFIVAIAFSESIFVPAVMSREKVPAEELVSNNIVPMISVDEDIMPGDKLTLESTERGFITPSGEVIPFDTGEPT